MAGDQPDPRYPAQLGKAAFVLPDVKHVTSLRRLWRYPRMRLGHASLRTGR